jgi:Fur family ferric uptake transcriptional regulator
VKTAARREIQKVLRAAGLRATQPRVAVLRELMAARSPLSHGDVADTLSGDGFDRATVYRNLMDLTEAGLARRSDIGDHVWRFELMTPESDHQEETHPHFICGECGAVSCLPEDAVSVKPGRGTPRALKSRAVSVQVRGVCDSCD